MAHGNTYVCATCGKEFEYCPKCAVTKPSYDAERYCSESNANIFSILSKHGCNLATAEETLEALKDYDITNLTKSIQLHINTLQSKKVEVSAKVKSEATKEVETTIKKSSFRTQE